MADPFESKDKIQHQITDTDLNWSSPHHTIGKGPTQAAAGRHRHTYNEIDEPPVIPGEPVPPDLTPFVRKIGDDMSGNLVNQGLQVGMVWGTSSEYRGIEYGANAAEGGAAILLPSTTSPTFIIGSANGAGVVIRSRAIPDASKDVQFQPNGNAIIPGYATTGMTLGSGWSGGATNMTLRAGWVLLNFSAIKKSTTPTIGEVIGTVAADWKPLAWTSEVWFTGISSVAATGGGIKAYLLSLDASNGQMRLRGGAGPAANETIYGSVSYPVV